MSPNYSPKHAWRVPTVGSIGQACVYSTLAALPRLSEYLAPLDTRQEWRPSAAWKTRAEYQPLAAPDTLDPYQTLAALSRLGAYLSFATLDRHAVNLPP